MELPNRSLAMHIWEGWNLQTAGVKIQSLNHLKPVINTINSEKKDIKTEVSCECELALFGMHNMLPE